MALTTHLTTLEQSGLIHRLRIDPELEYLFRHALVQDAAYASLLKTDRKLLHRQVGETLEQLYGPHLPEIYPTLARHFAEANEVSRACQYYQRAGDTALRTYANAEAERHYRAALAFATTDHQRAELQAAIGEALFSQSQFDGAIAAWEMALLLYQPLGQHDARGRLYARSARAAWHAGDIPRGLGICEIGVQSLATAPESVGLAWLWHEYGRMQMFNGNPDVALRHCQQALALAEKFGDLELQSDVLTTYGVIRGVAVEERLKALRQAIQIAETHKFWYTATRAHNNLGEVYFARLGDLRNARYHYLRAAAIAAMRGALVGSEFCQCNAVAAALLLGELDTVAQQTATAPPLSGAQQVLLQREFNATGLLRYRGALAAARTQLLALRAQALPLQIIELIYAIDVYLLEIAYETGEVASLDTLLTEALSMGDSYMTYVIWPRALQCALLAARHHTVEATALLEEIETHATAERLTADGHHLALAHARVAVACGELADACAHYERAATLYAERGMRWYHARTLTEWARYTDSHTRTQLLTDANQIFDAIGAEFYKIADF